MRPLLAVALAFATVITSVGAAPGAVAASIVVFPLLVNGDANKDAGSKLAVILAQQLADNGVSVKAAPPGTQRKDFLEAARSLGTDYYLTGFVTPLGREVSVVEQVVSSTSGTVVFSNTAQLLTYNDAAGQGGLLAQAILRHAGRGLVSIDAPPARSTGTPEPSKSNEANISGFFKRKPKAQAAQAAALATSPAVLASAAGVATAAALKTPAPKTVSSPRATPAPTQVPKPTAVAIATPRLDVAAAASGRTLGFFATGGTAPSERRAYAQQALSARLASAGRTVKNIGELSQAEACAQTGAKALLRVELATQTGDAAYGRSTIAQLDLTVSDCAGGILVQKHFERDGTGARDWQRAIDRVSALAAGAIETATR